VRRAYDVLNRSFDRIWVVTLARAADRQARVAERLRGLDYRFHVGADKAELDVAALERDGVYDARRARAVDRYGRPMTPGQLGCAISHRQLYEDAVRSGRRRVLVLEDDVVPDAEALAELPAALAELPPAWELAYLGWTKFEEVTPGDRLKRLAYVPLAALGLVKWTPRQLRLLHPRAFSPHLRRAGYHHCTHAYAFTLDGARKLLAEQTPIAHVADHLLIHLVLDGRVAAFSTRRSLFGQEHAPGGPGSYVGSSATRARPR
jgi:glycosyl transferase family 25